MRVKAALFLAAMVGMSLIFGFFLYIGHYDSYVDHDEHAVYFFKKIPTLRSEFTNPFANEGDAPSVDKLSPDIRSELADYCKYAYGLTRNDSTSLEDCRERIIQEIQ